MKFIELLRKYTDEEIIDELKKNYNDIHDESYKSALTELRELTPSTEAQDLKINVEIIKEQFGEPIEPFLSCDGIGPDENGEIVRWGIEFDKWEEWLAKDICEDNFKELSEITILAGIIWEMTFIGYTQKDVQDKADELNERFKYIEEHPEEMVELTQEDLDKIQKEAE